MASDYSLYNVYTTNATWPNASLKVVWLIRSQYILKTALYFCPLVIKSPDVNTRFKRSLKYHNMYKWNRGSLLSGVDEMTPWIWIQISLELNRGNVELQSITWSTIRRDFRNICTVYSIKENKTTTQYECTIMLLSLNITYLREKHKQVTTSEFC